MLWVWFTLLAALMQSMRNALQKELSREVSVLAATLARFIYAGPLAALYLYALYQRDDAVWPQFQWSFYFYVAAAAVMQIVATALMVQVFRQRNYAIGVGLAKSEAIFAAVLGMLFFASPLSWLGWLGVTAGAIAIFLLSGVKDWRQLPLSTILYGAGSGAAFALTSLWVREASLVLQVPFPFGAAWVLVSVICSQTLLLCLYLLIRDRASLLALWQRPRLTFLTSLCSGIGSFGWFSAMSLMSVPVVKTLGQVEVLFTLLLSHFWFKEKLRAHDGVGLGLVVLAAVLVLWA